MTATTEPTNYQNLYPTAAAANLVSCHSCFTLSPAGQKRCHNCGSKLHSRTAQSLQKTLALLLTSLVLYIPANIFPIMYTTYLGERTANTILGGVGVLWDSGSYPIAIIILIASVLVPIGKILVLGWLCFAVQSDEVRSYRTNQTLYRITEFIGRWSMIDVFVVAILVALIQMGSFISVLPGEAAISFGLLVITTMLAANSFDSRLIWEPLNAPEQTLDLGKSETNQQESTPGKQND